jgi:hypothetical protein
MVGSIDHIIEPENKDEQWHKKVCENVFEEWDNIDINSFSHGHERYVTNRKFSLGKNDTDEYKDVFESEGDPRFSYAKATFKPIPVIPKFRRIVNEKHGSMKLDIVADAIDPIALSEKKRYETREHANIVARQALGAVGMNTSVLDSGEIDQPKTTEELAMKMEFGYKHNMAIDIEKRIKAVFSENRINDSLFPKVRSNLFDYGVAFVKDEYDRFSKTIKTKIVDVGMMGVSPCKNEDFSDATWFFEIDYITPGELKSIRKDLTDEEIESIVESCFDKATAKNWIRTDSTYNTNHKLNKNLRIPVMKLEFLTTDRTVWDVRFDEDGEEYYETTSFKNQNGENVEIEDVPMWYKASWVIGTNVVYDTGPVENQKRPYDDVYRSVSSYTGFAPEMEEMETWSMVDTLIPIVDKIHIAWYKLENVINQARPRGILIEIGSMEDVDLGDGQTKTALDLMDLYNHTGSLVYRRQTLSGDYSNGRPIDELNNGIGDEAGQWFAIINNQFSIIKDMLGFNDVSAGSNVNPKMLNGVANAQMQTTEYAINHILRAERTIYEKLAESVSIRVQDQLALMEDNSQYENVLGSEHIKSINEENDYVERIFGIEVRELPTGIERQRLEEDLQKSVDKGELTTADKYIVLRIQNIKQAEQYMVYLIKKNQERQQELEAQKIKMQEESNINSANASAEAEKMKEEARADGESRVETVKGEEARKTLRLKYQLEKDKAAWDSMITNVDMGYSKYDKRNSGERGGSYNSGTTVNDKKERVV